MGRATDPANLNPSRVTGQKYKERGEEGLLNAVVPMASLEFPDKLCVTLLPEGQKTLDQ